MMLYNPINTFTDLTLDSRRLALMGHTIKMTPFIFALSLVSCCLCFNHSSVLSNEVFTYHNETSFKAHFAYQVVQKIFNAFNQWFFTITFCEFTYFENRILKYTENYGDGYPVMLLNGCQNLNKSKVKPKLNRHGKTAYVITSDDLTIEDSEYAIEALTRTGVFKPRSAVIYVLNLPVQVDNYFYYSMKYHFQLMWSRSITNSIIVLWSDRLKMYTYNPFYKEINDITNVKDISKYLARIYEDLYGYELRLSVFRKVYTSDATGPVYCNSILTKTIMKRLNATCKPLAPRDDNTVGDLLENGTATGVTADLLEGYTDLELNSRILMNSFYGNIDTTYPLMQDELCFLVQKSKKQSTYMTVLKLISINMLLLFLFTFIIFIVVTVITRRVETKLPNVTHKKSNLDTVMDSVKCFIRQTVDIKFSGPVFRWLVFLIMTYSLIIDCVIDGIIISAITYPRYKLEVDTVSEILQRNLTIGVHNRHLRVFIKSLGEDAKEVIHKTEVVNDRKIKRIIDNREFKYALLLRKADAKYISRKPSNVENGRPLFHLASNCPVPCYIVFGLRYGSPYLPRLDYLFSHLSQGGILQYWFQSDEYTLFKKPYQEIVAIDSKDRKALTIGNVKEIFIVWSMGLFVSTIIFIIEVIVYYVHNTSHITF